MMLPQRPGLLDIGADTARFSLASPPSAWPLNDLESLTTDGLPRDMVAYSDTESSWLIGSRRWVADDWSTSSTRSTNWRGTYIGRLDAHPTLLTHSQCSSHTDYTLVTSSQQLFTVTIVIHHSHLVWRRHIHHDVTLQNSDPTESLQVHRVASSVELQSDFKQLICVQCSVPQSTRHDENVIKTSRSLQSAYNTPRLRYLEA